MLAARTARTVRTTICEKFLYDRQGGPMGRLRRRLGGLACAPADAPAAAGRNAGRLARMSESGRRDGAQFSRLTAVTAWTSSPPGEPRNPAPAPILFPVGPEPVSGACPRRCAIGL